MVPLTLLLLPYASIARIAYTLSLTVLESPTVNRVNAAYLLLKMAAQFARLYRVRSLAFVVGTFRLFATCGRGKQSLK